MSSSAVEIRRELVRRVTLDLEGPALGDNERLSGSLGRRRVLDRYLVGMLAPKNTVWVEETRADDDGVGGDPDSVSAVGRPAAKPILMPSAMALSFAVDGSEKRLTISAAWGHYLKE